MSRNKKIAPDDAEQRRPVENKVDAQAQAVRDEWESIFESLSDMVTIHDENFNIIRANKSARQMLKLNLTDNFSKKCFRCYHGTEKPPEGCPSCKSLEIGQMCISEIFEPHLNRHLEIRAIPRYDANRRCIGLVHIVRDITERKEAEEALHSSEEQHRTILQTAMDGFWLADKEGRILEVNEAYCRMSGYSTEELLAMRVPDLDAAETTEDTAARIQKIMAQGDDRFETRHRRKDGSMFQVEVSVQYRSEEGRLVAFLRDITERKRMEESLTEQKIFTEKLIENSAAATFVLNPEHKVILWNKACEELTGSAADAMAGTGNHWQAFYDHKRPCIADIVLDGDYDRLSGLYASYAKSTLVPDGLHAEGWYINLNGRDRYIMFDAAPVYDGRGELLAAIETLHDVTEQKRTDEDLRQLFVRQKAILASVPDIIMEVNNEKVYTWANRAGLEFFGENVIDKEAALYFIGEQDTYDRVTPLFMGDENLIYVESWQWRKDGEKRLLAWWCHVLKDAEGNVAGAISTARDITEHKQAEAAMRLQSVALQAAANAIVITDKSGTIEWVNPAFTTLTGYSAEESIGRNPRELVKSGVHGHDFYKRLWDTLLAGEVWRGQITNRHKNGALYPEGQTITPVKDVRGEITHFIAIKRDLTEHSKLEEQLRQSQKMESIGTLAGGIAHDFNNILSAIIGYGQLTQMKMSADDQHRNYIENILEAADRAARLTKELLLFSRKQAMDKKQLDLNLVVARVEKFLTKVIGEDVAYNTVLHEEPLPVLADGQQLEQVLMNLATNARDSMPHGGDLTVTTGHVIVNKEFVSAHGYLTPGQFALITVTDSGEGMDEATRQRIFEPFFTTKEVGKGTGLGLAVSYGIIKQHDGYISVYSEPGTGTTFKIYLPLIAAVTEEDPLKEFEEAPVGGTETILLAEDDKTVRVLTSKLLTEFGYTVIEAVDGFDAVIRFKENSESIDLILSDLIMPKMNGKEAVDEIRKIRPGIRVIFSSGYAPETVQDRVSLDEDVNVISKPVSPRELLRVVRSVLDSR